MARVISRLHQAFYLYLPALIYIPLSLLFLIFSIQILSWKTALTSFVFGFFLWSLVEYVLHRFVFHYQATGPLFKKVIHYAHGAHHQVPHETRRAVLTGSLPLAVLFYVLCWFVLPRGFPEAVSGGLFLGYLGYDAFHYHLHQHTPTTKLGKFLKTYHFKHHYQNPKLGFGVTSPFWDWIFKTRFEP